MKPGNKLTLVAAMLMVAGFAFAQTWTPTSTPNQDWQAVASSADGRNLIAVGQSWTYCLSTNSGSTWSTNTEPQILSENGSWTSIVSSADGTKLVGINYTSIWVSTNSGLTWYSNNVPGAVGFAALALSADGNQLMVADGNFEASGSLPGLHVCPVN